MKQSLIILAIISIFLNRIEGIKLLDDEKESECQLLPHFPLPPRYNTSIGGDSFFESFVSKNSVYCKDGRYYILRSAAIDFAKQYFDSDLYRFKVPLPVFEEEFEKAWEIYDHSADSKVDVDDFPTVLRIITDSFALKFKI